MLDAVRSGRPRISAENTASVRKAFSRSTTKSIRTAARELELYLLQQCTRFYAKGYDCTLTKCKCRVATETAKSNSRTFLDDFPGLC